MALEALGYVGFGSAALDDWRQFGTGLVGLQAVERGPSLLSFRMDDRKQRIVIDRSLPEGARFFGWEVADASALEKLAARLEEAEVEVSAERQTLADARRVRGLISFRDPAGNRLEAFYGAEIDDTPVSPGRSSLEPTLYQHQTEASGAVCSSWMRTFRPLSKRVARIGSL